MLVAFKEAKLMQPIPFLSQRMWLDASPFIVVAISKWAGAVRLGLIAIKLKAKTKAGMN